MSTITMNVSLPDTLKAFVDRRVADRGYGSHSEYVRDLVRRDEMEAAKDQMRALIAAGLNSPPGKPWVELRDELLQRVKSSSAK
jgi:antitoxin ParD1/3/4